VIALGGTISLGGVFVASFTTKLVPFMCLFCMLNGIGCGMCYLVPLICSWEWFPEKKGMMTGFIVGGYGFASFIFAFLSTKLVNPNNLKPEIYDAEN